MQSEKSGILQAAFEFIGAPFRTLQLFIQDLSRVDDRLQDESIVVRLLALATMPFRLLGGFLSLMVQNWPTSRSGLAAILGVPAFFTMIGLLGAWALADKFRSNTMRIGFNEGYLNLNVENFGANHNLALKTQGPKKEELEQIATQYAESSLAYGQKLVELDPEDLRLKYLLGLSFARSGDLFAANDVMSSIAPDDEPGYLDAHLWRTQYLAQDSKTAEELKASLGLIEKHLAMATELDKENLNGTARLANIYMTYANLLEEQSEERLKYLEKADEKFREIIANESDLESIRSTKLNILRASVLIRKQLEALAPEKYSVDTEIDRVKNRIASLQKLAVRHYPDNLLLWRLLIDSASEIRQFDFAIEIANLGLKSAPSPETKQGLLKTKSLTFRKHALSINKFDDFEMYKKRFFYLCEAVRTDAREPSNYILLLQFIGKENEKPSIQLARQLGLSEPGDAVPIKPEWLRRACVETKYTSFLNTMIGIHEFHQGNNEAAILSWTVAQQFTPTSRDFISSIFEFHVRSRQDKLDNFEIMVTEFLKNYPEAARIRVLRGTYYFQEKEFQKAIDDFRYIIESNPNELILHQRIKTCYQYMGQRSSANDEQDILETKLKRLSVEEQQAIRQVLKRLDEETTTE